MHYTSSIHCFAFKKYNLVKHMKTISYLIESANILMHFNYNYNIHYEILYNALKTLSKMLPDYFSKL